jgi:hypothetical protein
VLGSLHDSLVHWWHHPVVLPSVCPKSYKQYSHDMP